MNLHPCKVAIRKNVSEFPHYTVDNFGECRSLMTNKPLSNSVSNGYHSVRFCKDKVHKRYLVHRLVLASFLGFNTEKIYVDHKDDNRSNNTLTNLRWVTQSENVKKSYAVGNAKCIKAMLGRIGKNHPASMPVAGYNENGEEVVRFESISLARIAGYAINFYKKDKHESICKGLKFKRI